MLEKTQLRPFELNYVLNTSYTLSKREITEGHWRVMNESPAACCSPFRSKGLQTQFSNVITDTIPLHTMYSFMLTGDL